MTTTPPPVKQRHKPRRTVDTKPVKCANDIDREQKKIYQAAAREIKTIDDLVKFFEIQQWDYLLIGDGSASTRDHAGGWATACIQKDPADLRWYFGSSAYASNISCEMMAYIDPLLDLIAAGKSLQARDIHIITDCEFLVEYWPRPGSWKANKQLWQILGTMPRIGLRLHFHWVPRDCIAFNQMADELAGLSRLTAVFLQDEIPKLTAKHFNPAKATCDDSKSLADPGTPESAASSPSTTIKRRRKKSTKSPGKPSLPKSTSDTSSSTPPPVSP